MFYGRGFVKSQHVEWPKRVHRRGLVRVPVSPSYASRGSCPGRPEHRPSRLRMCVYADSASVFSRWQQCIRSRSYGQMNIDYFSERLQLKQNNGLLQLQLNAF